MKILVTGSNGFVGKHLVNRFDGHEIVHYDLPDNDLLDWGNLDGKVRGCDFVVHVAAIADLYQTAEAPTQTFRVNVEGTYNVVQACKRFDKPLVYISTACVYGNQGERPTDEESRPNPVEFYAMSKLAGEVMVRDHWNSTILRIGTVFGPGMRPALFNYKILDAIKNDKEFEIYGNGSASRNYIYIDELIRGIALAIEIHPKTIINLVGDRRINLDEVVKTAEEVTGEKAIYKKVAPRSMGDVTENISNSKALKELGWKPLTTFARGMQLTWDWMNEKDI